MFWEGDFSNGIFLRMVPKKEKKCMSPLCDRNPRQSLGKENNVIISYFKLKRRFRKSNTQSISCHFYGVVLKNKKSKSRGAINKHSYYTITNIGLKLNRQVLSFPGLAYVTLRTHKSSTFWR